MRVKDVVLRAPVTVGVDASIGATARVMSQEGVGSVIVVDEGRPVGIVTDRDLVVRAMARDAALDGRVDGVMTMGVVAVDADTDVREAVRLFGTHPVRRIPVVEGHEVVGVIAVDDLLVALTAELSDVTRGLSAQVMFPHGGDEAHLPAATGS